MNSDSTTVCGIVTVPGVYLEKILSDPPRRNPASLLDGLVASPRVIASLVQSIPMPWEAEKTVICFYNTDGIVLECKSSSSEDSINYMCKWLRLLQRPCPNGAEAAPKARNFTLGEYRELRSKHPFVTLSARKRKEQMFPALYGRAGAALECKSHQPSTEEAPDAARTVASRNSVRVLLRMDRHRKQRKKAKKAPQAPEEPSPGTGRIASSRYKKPEKEYRSSMEWCKLSRLYLSACNRMLNYVVKERRLNYVSVSEKYEVEAKRALKTREKKKSRLGQTFHTVKELVKLLARLVDAVEESRRPETSPNEGMRRLFKEFSSVGVTTGIYKYKHSAIRQVHEASRASKALAYYAEKTRVPYDLLWCEPWRVWALFLQGVSPLLESRLASYVLRRREGRKKREKPVTKQRALSHSDIQSKALVFREIAEFARLGKFQEQAVKNVLKLAWKLWKRADGYAAEIQKCVSKNNFPGLSEAALLGIQGCLVRSIEEKGSAWCASAVQQWNRLVACKVKNKKELVKAQSKALRLSMILNKTMQRLALEKEFSEDFAPEEAAASDSATEALRDREVLSLSTYSEDILLDILSVSLDRLSSTYSRHLKREEEKELEYIKARKNALGETLSFVAKRVAQKRGLGRICIKYAAHGVSYSYGIEERMADSFLDHLIAYHARAHGGCNTLPLDKEPLALSLSKRAGDMCTAITGFFEKAAAPSSVYFTSLDTSRMLAEVERPLLERCLRQALHKDIASYVLQRASSVLEYKDIASAQRLGVCKGLEFYPSVSECLMQEMDRAVLADARSSVLMHFRCGATSYFLHTEDFFSRISKKRAAAEGLAECSFRAFLGTLSENSEGLGAVDPRTDHLAGLPTHLGSRVFSRQHNARDAEKERFCVIAEGLAGKMHSTRIDAFPFVVTVGDFDLVFPRERSPYLLSSAPSLDRFKLSMNKLLYDSTGSSFSTIVERWNRAVVQSVLFFREHMSFELSEAIRAHEEALKRRIMCSINTKMKKRFPNALFYSGKEFSGLGFVSFEVLRHVVPSWSDEAARSLSVYSRILAAVEKAGPAEDKEALARAVLVSLKSEGADARSVGVPRISAFLHKPKSLHVEAGWRLRNYLCSGNRRWTSEAHDGQWISWKSYKKALSLSNAYSLKCSTVSMRNSSGDSTHVYAGSLYRAVQQKWNSAPPPLEEMYTGSLDSSPHAPSLGESRRKTRAQIGSAARMPNRMFTLWWSPIINRSRIDVGHPEVVESTGITMRSKISSLRTSYKKLFSDGLWAKMHKEILALVASSLEQGIIKHGISCIDLPPVDEKADFSDSLAPSMRFDLEGLPWPGSAWVFLRLRWGDIDAAPVEEECASYCGRMTAEASAYTHSRFGLVVLFDICQCKYAIQATHELLQGLAGELEERLDMHVSSLDCFRIFQSRLCLLVGRSPKEHSEAVTDPRSIFAESHLGTFFLQISSTAAHALDMASGRVFRYEFKPGAKISKILERVHALLLQHNVQRVCAPAREHSLLRKSGISCAFFLWEIEIDLAQIPRSVRNAYAAWPGLKSKACAFSSFCRLALVLRHSSACSPESLSLMLTPMPEEAWEKTEVRLCADLLVLGSPSGTSAPGPSSRVSSSSECMQRLLFGAAGSSERPPAPSSGAWTRMTSWRDRYKIADSFSALQQLKSSACTHVPMEKRESSELSSAEDSVCIGQDVLQHILHISDSLTPILGFVCESAQEGAVFVMPRQLFSSKHFFISPFDTTACSIRAVVQTVTPFSQNMAFTYSGVAFPSPVPVLLVDVANGACLGSRCTPECVGGTVSFSVRSRILVEVLPIKSAFLTAAGWNRNMCEPHGEPHLTPCMPLPFYAEEFRASHFRLG
ncbi:pre-mRNA-processing factor 8 [Nematocida major]|uniref:pre-mRNA-processing factor 8 n=1 Tax=Nematocida major TaxID=1912982 RepID=UPI002007DF3E|nr:pre-mRNA-processing factor 8 [Nematocida major]KAH9386466.1 pre-mRNA-processing factor 8 [Nematocida major]